MTAVDTPAEQVPGAYKLLALDIDGTLLDGRGQLRQATTRAVRRVAAAGVTVVLASGRSYRQARPYAQALDLCEEPLIVVGGALTVRAADARVWRSRRFAPQVAGDVLGLIRAAGLAVFVTVEGDPRGEYLIWRGEPRDAIDEDRLRRLVGIFHFVEDQPPELEAIDLGRVLRITVNACPSYLPALEATLATAVPGLVRWHVIHAPDLKYPLMEIFPTGIDKWQAVLGVAESLGLTARQVVAIGDDANDLPMIAAAGLGVAMGNAVAAVQTAARCVIGHHDADGLAEFLNGMSW